MILQTWILKWICATNKYIETWIHFSSTERKFASDYICVQQFLPIFTDRKGKVMFSQVSLCPQSASWLLDHCSSLLLGGRYASYWNAFLLKLLERYELYIVYFNHWTSERNTTELVTNGPWIQTRLRPYSLEKNKNAYRPLQWPRGGRGQGDLCLGDLCPGETPSPSIDRMTGRCFWKINFHCSR